MSYCEKCGNKNRSEASYCKKCGTKLKSIETERQVRTSLINHTSINMGFYGNSFNTRIGRLDYWLGHLMIPLVPMIIVLIFFDDNDIAWAIFCIIWLYYEISLNIRRAHDTNNSGWTTIFLLIPLVNFFYGIILAFGESEKNENQYGAPPHFKDEIASDRIKRILAIN